MTVIKTTWSESDKLAFMKWIRDVGAEIELSDTNHDHLLGQLNWYSKMITNEGLENTLKFLEVFDDFLDLPTPDSVNGKVVFLKDNDNLNKRGFYFSNGSEWSKMNFPTTKKRIIKAIGNVPFNTNLSIVSNGLNYNSSGDAAMTLVDENTMKNWDKVKIFINGVKAILEGVDRDVIFLDSTNFKLSHDLDNGDVVEIFTTM